MQIKILTTSFISGALFKLCLEIQATRMPFYKLSIPSSDIYNQLYTNRKTCYSSFHPPLPPLPCSKN